MDPNTPADPAELRAEIEQTRSELGATMEALAAKVDVKARTKEAAHDAVVEAKGRIHAVGERAAVIGRRLPAATIVGAAVLVGLLIVVARRRRS